MGGSTDSSSAVTTSYGSARPVRSVVCVDHVGAEGAVRVGGEAHDERAVVADGGFRLAGREDTERVVDGKRDGGVRLEAVAVQVDGLVGVVVRPVGGDLGGAVRGFGEVAVRALRQVAPEVGDVEALVAVVVGVDVPPAGRAPDLRVEPERRQVEPDGGGRLVDAAAAVRADVGVPGGEAGLHDRRLLHGEPLEPAVRPGERDDERLAGQARRFARGGRQGLSHAPLVQRERGEPFGVEVGPVPVVGVRRLAALLAPERPGLGRRRGARRAPRPWGRGGRHLRDHERAADEHGQGDRRPAPRDWRTANSLFWSPHGLDIGKRAAGSREAIGPSVGRRRGRCSPRSASPPATRPHALALFRRAERRLRGCLGVVGQGPNAAKRFW